jgi:predicted DNA-binding protein YlxM (UPF0122 family)
MPLELKTEALSWLTPYEERIIEAIIENGDVKTAASELKIAKSTVYGVISRIRLKLVKSQNTVNKINVVKKKSRTLRRLLVPIQKVAVPETIEELIEEVEVDEGALF